MTVIRFGNGGSGMKDWKCVRSDKGVRGDKGMSHVSGATKECRMCQRNAHDVRTVKGNKEPEGDRSSWNELIEATRRINSKGCLYIYMSQDDPSRLELIQSTCILSIFWQNGDPGMGVREWRFQNGEHTECDIVTTACSTQHGMKVGRSSRLWSGLTER